ncbi:MAG: CmpA/NrtA family ABC transporter substrate-binding protein [Gammaproteobacteria bacterium]
MMTEKSKLPVPEKHELTLGFIPLVDCCVLVAAREQGFFKKYGLEVSLSREASWANIRDKVCVGALDGAHMLAGMTIATTLGLGFNKKPMVTSFSMNLNGNAITVSKALYERLLEKDANIENDPNLSAKALKQILQEDSAAGKPMLNFAMVYPYSNHNYEIRYWMAAAGINPDRDVALKVIPPQYMVDNLKDGLIDGFCVGEPWNSCAVSMGVGKLLTSGYQIWNNSPEKVFGVTRDWAAKHPKTHLCLVMALIEAAAWIDNANNRDSFANVLASDEYIGIEPDIIRASLAGNFNNHADAEPRSIPDMHVFHRYQANFPWCSHATWIISQMYRWGQLQEVIDIKQIAEAVYRPDVYRLAASRLGLTYPSFNYKTEGEQGSEWKLDDDDLDFKLGADKYMDNIVFDPDNVVSYLSGHKVENCLVELAQLEKLNR